MNKTTVTTPHFPCEHCEPCTNCGNECHGDLCQDCANELTAEWVESYDETHVVSR